MHPKPTKAQGDQRAWRLNRLPKLERRPKGTCASIVRGAWLMVHNDEGNSSRFKLTVRDAKGTHNALMSVSVLNDE